jgi:1-phosphatidylinositol-3-phosphate 5-kinase
MLEKDNISMTIFYPDDNGKEMITRWINRLLTLGTRACATVDPNVKKGDLLDIRPYCKIKVIAGGSYEDCAYISGVLFRKTVSHKRMAREIENPRIMLLGGGIEFTRTENRIASLETLFEQEEKYMEILVGKILKLKPDVLIVGRSVSRRAQELLLNADVVLVQRVKTNLLNRISRQTGATVISSTDHVMNQFGAKVLGKCNRFRLAAFRDNEVWIDSDSDHRIDGISSANGTKQRSIKALLADPELSNHERQAALAASKLGEDVLDGSQAVKSGLAKRGVAQTYVMLEGCPKHLGCSVVLRGANRASLKQVKTVFRFLVNVAYNLRLETSYLKERSARLRPDYVVQPKHTFSSSLCVDYGAPPSSTGRAVRPWNGSDATPSPESAEINAFDHQSILVTSIWMTEKTQCCPAEVKGICYYSLQDVALGQFLRDSCFNLSLKCQNPNCKKSVLDHSLSFVHNDGLINIMVSLLVRVCPHARADFFLTNNRVSCVG